MCNAGTSRLGQQVHHHSEVAKLSQLTRSFAHRAVLACCAAVEADRIRCLAGKYIIDNEIMKLMKKDAVVMHPLPRVDEVTREIWSLKRLQ